MTLELAIASVLVVDDSADVLSLVELRLRPENLRVTTASTYEEGARLAATLLPDLILLDVDLDGASGLELCRALKEDPVTSGIPIIFLTGAEDTETKVRGLDLGAVDFVTKPFNPAELRARVRAALRMKRAQDLLTRKAQIDMLTGLRNRAYLDERLAAEIALATRSGRPLSLVMIDLDHFKLLNDGYGHPFGDLVLQRVGDLLGRIVRPYDVACRYGGEELALILPDTDLAGAHAVAERARVHVRELQLAPRGKPITVTASFGVAEAFAAAGNAVPHPTSLVSAADAALYAAKHGGRDCVRSYSPSDRRSLRVA